MRESFAPGFVSCQCDNSSSVTLSCDMDTEEITLKVWCGVFVSGVAVNTYLVYTVCRACVTNIILCHQFLLTWDGHDLHVTITWYVCDHHMICMWPSHGIMWPSRDLHVTITWHACATFTTLILSYWLQEETWAVSTGLSENQDFHILQVYPCPAGYCRCVLPPGLNGPCTQVFTNNSDLDSECSCHRSGRQTFWHIIQLVFNFL